MTLWYRPCLGVAGQTYKAGTCTGIEIVFPQAFNKNQVLPLSNGCISRRSYSPWAPGWRLVPSEGSEGEHPPPAQLCPCRGAAPIPTQHPSRLPRDPGCSAGAVTARRGRGQPGDPGLLSQGQAAAVGLLEQGICAKNTGKGPSVHCSRCPRCSRGAKQFAVAPAGPRELLRMFPAE